MLVRKVKFAAPVGIEYDKCALNIAVE